MDRKKEIMINNTQGNYFTRYTGKAQEVFSSKTFTDVVEKFVDEKLSQFDLRYLDFNNSQTELLNDNKEPIFFNERVRKTHISSISDLHQNQQLVWEVENIFVSLSNVFYDFDTKEIVWAGRPFDRSIYFKNTILLFKVVDGMVGEEVFGKVILQYIFGFISKSEMVELTTNYILEQFQKFVWELSENDKDFQKNLFMYCPHSIFSKKEYFDILNSKEFFEELEYCGKEFEDIRMTPAIQYVKDILNYKNEDLRPEFFQSQIGLYLLGVTNKSNKKLLSFLRDNKKIYLVPTIKKELGLGTEEVLSVIFPDVKPKIAALAIIKKHSLQKMLSSVSENEQLMTIVYNKLLDDDFLIKHSDFFKENLIEEKVNLDLFFNKDCLNNTTNSHIYADSDLLDQIINSSKFHKEVSVNLIYEADSYSDIKAQICKDLNLLLRYKLKETCNPITVTVTVVNNNSSQKEFETFKFEMSKLFSYLYPNKKVTVLNRNLSDLNQSDLINVDLILHDESLHTVDVLNSSIYNIYVNMVSN